MATELTLQEITIAGITPTTAATDPDAGNYCTVPKYWRTYVFVDNGHTSPVTVTLHAQKADDAGDYNDESYAVTNATERLIGPVRWNMLDGDQNLHISYTGGNAACEIGVFQIGAD